MTTPAPERYDAGWVAPDQLTRWQLLMYRVVRAALAGFCYLFWRVRVEGREHIPATGPFVLAPVHRSNIDTPITACMSRRRMRYMGKDSMWKYGWSAWFFTSMGGFPVHRGTVDREALRRCEATLRAGEPLVIFPEGTRREGPLVDEVFEGAAFVAARTGVPIVPVGIGGSDRAMPRHARMLRPVKVAVVIGPPLYPGAEGARGSRRRVRELTEELTARLQDLYDAAQAATGRPNPPRP